MIQLLYFFILLQKPGDFVSVVPESYVLFLSCADPEVENEDQPSSENDSQNQSAEQMLPLPQTVGLADQESPGNPLESPSEPPSPADSEEAAGFAPSEQISSPTETQETAGLDGECTDLDNQLQDQPETEEDPSPNVSWGTKAQPMDSILADWNEDIEAFEMMEKDELWLSVKCLVVDI